MSKRPELGSFDRLVHEMQFAAVAGQASFTELSGDRIMVKIEGLLANSNGLRNAVNNVWSAIEMAGFRVTTQAMNGSAGIVTFIVASEA